MIPLSNAYSTAKPIPHEWFNDAADAINGPYTVVACTGGTITLTETQGRPGFLKITGVLASAGTIVVPTRAGYKWVVWNATTGAFSLTVKTAAGTGIAVPQGTVQQLSCDGTDVIEAAPPTVSGGGAPAPASAHLMTDRAEASLPNALNWAALTGAPGLVSVAVAGGVATLTLVNSVTGSAGSLKSVATTGLMTVTGMAAASTRAKTVRDADDTLLELGGSYTPSGTWGFSGLVSFTSAPPADATAAVLRLGAALVGASAAGNALGINLPAGFTGNGFWMQKDGGACLAKIDYTGGPYFAGIQTWNKYALFTVAAAQGGDAFIGTSETNTGTGSFLIQAGFGSAAYGGGISLYANDHSTKPGHVAVGLSGNINAKFRINKYGNDSSTDVFVITQPGLVGIGPDIPLDWLSIGATPVASATRAVVNLGNLALSGASTSGTWIGANPAGGNTVDPFCFQIGGQINSQLTYAGALYLRGGANIRAATTVGSAVALSDGGVQRTFSEATATLSGANTTIQVNVPAGVRVLGCQLRVDTAITSGDGGTSWAATYTGGATQAIGAAGQAFTKNTKVSATFNDTTETDVLGSEVDVLIDCDGAFTFNAGVIRAIVYYETFAAMGAAA